MTDSPTPSEPLIGEDVAQMLAESTTIQYARWLPWIREIEACGYRIVRAEAAEPAALPLTEDEVAALRPGVAVEVIWSGGNGPHHYIVHEMGDVLYAGDPRNDNALTGIGSFIGQEHYHTRVWRLVRAAEPAALDVEQLALYMHQARTSNDEPIFDMDEARRRAHIVASRLQSPDR